MADDTPKDGGKKVVQARPDAPAPRVAAPAPEADRVDEKLMKPGKYEVTPETTFEVKVYLTIRNKRWIVVGGPGEDVDTQTMVFRMWGYDEMVEMKKMATEFDAEKRVHTVDHDMLNRLKVQRLLQSWTFGGDNPRLKIHHVQGVLTDESWKAFTKLQPNIIVFIFDEMNRVYELNG